jgi:ferredoxin
VELDFENWRMARKDGKSVLIGSTEKKGFHTVRLNDDDIEHHERVASACPVDIIKVTQI